MLALKFTIGINKPEEDNGKNMMPTTVLMAQPPQMGMHPLQIATTPGMNAVPMQPMMMQGNPFMVIFPQHPCAII